MTGTVSEVEASTRAILDYVGGTLGGVCRLPDHPYITA